MYSKIEIVVPNSAVAGTVVPLEIKVTNLCDYTIYVTPIININGMIYEGSYETVIPKGTRSWYFGFTMPSSDVVIIADSWCEDTFEWQKDSSVTKTVLLEGEVPVQPPSIITQFMPVLMMVLMFGLILPMIAE